MNFSTLLALGLAFRSWLPRPRRVRERADPLLRELALLQSVEGDRLHFGIEKIGLLALDLKGGEEVFWATGETRGLSLHEMVLGGASIPGLFPPLRAKTPARRYWLVDGGLSRSVPVERALLSPFGRCRVLAVDLQVLRGFRERAPDRWEGLERKHPERVRRIRPRVTGTGTVWCRRNQGEDLFRAGEEALTPEVLTWLRAPGGFGALEVGRRSS
jgi:predicted acylesterase/phospholipase RssA